MIYTVAADEWTIFDASGDLTGATIQLLVQKVGELTSVALTTEVVDAPTGVVRARTQSLTEGKYRVQMKVTQGADGPTTFPVGYQTLRVLPTIPQP